MLQLFEKGLRRLRPGHAPAPECAGERLVRTRIGARQFEVRSDDHYLEHIRGEFEPGTVRLFTALVRPHDTVLDVGANVGCTSLLFGQLAGRVISFEPSPSTYALLQKNLAAASLPNVTAVNLGLGREDGAFELTFAPENRSGGFVSNNITASDGHAVEQISIAAGDRWLREAGCPRVDFVKIDVEGFERHVIEGLAGTLAASKPVVVLELNHWCLNAFQRTSVPEFFDFLRGVFPVLYAVDDKEAIARDLHNNNDAYHVMYHHIVNNFRYPNLVGAFDRERVQNLLTTQADGPQ